MTSCAVRSGLGFSLSLDSVFNRIFHYLIALKLQTTHIEYPHKFIEKVIQIQNWSR